MDEFCGFYPFHTYQFDLFQLAIQQLSKHGVFTGKYLSVGERSMLAVFQEVAKSVRNEDVGHLATFDLMYDGISASIRGDMQTTIKMAESRLGEGLPIRILKSLFLLKWVREFKATESAFSCCSRFTVAHQIQWIFAKREFNLIKVNIFADPISQIWQFSLAPPTLHGRVKFHAP